MTLAIAKACAVVTDYGSKPEKMSRKPLQIVADFIAGWNLYPVKVGRIAGRVAPSDRQISENIVGSRCTYRPQNNCNLMFGILSINKPVGPTSRDCVNLIQRLIRPEKAGHAGTLDPLASGVLLVPVGQAVRLVDTIHELPKEYLGTFQLGVSSDSADTESELRPVVDAPRIERETLESVIPKFVGVIEQVPPVYSAIWIGGKRAHELARDGKHVDIPARQVDVKSIEIVRYDYPTLQLKICCGSGTYIRSLGRDIARELGSDAVMTELIRTRIGPFVIEESVSIEQWTSKLEVERALLPASLGVQHWTTLKVSPNVLMRIHQGKTIDASEMAQLGVADSESNVAILDETGELRSLLKRLESGHWRSDKSFLVCTDRIEESM